jgi:hypothetical protein
MSEIIVPNKIPVALHPSPLRLDVRTHVAQEGQTILDILLDIPNLPPEVWTHGLVFLGEWEVPRNLWNKVKPKGNSRYILRICIRFRDGGGGEGGGKSIIGTIAAIALVIAVTAISGGALTGIAGTTLFAAGSTSAALAAAGVAIVGSLAINALSPTPSLGGAGETEDSDNVSSLGSAAVRGNVLGAGKPIPFVAGKHRVSPPHIILPWSESVNDDQFVYTIVGLNGAHLFEDIRVNGAPIEDFADIDYEVRDVVNDDTDITLITQQVYENQVNSEVSGHKIKDDATDELQNEDDPEIDYPQWHSARTRLDPDEVWLTFAWSTLIRQDDAGGTAPGGMGVRMRIRKAGSSAWINLPEFHAQRERPQPFRGIIKLVFEEPPTSLTRPDQAPSFPPWKAALFVTDTENDEDFAVDDYFDDTSTLFAQNVGQIDGTVIVYLDPEIFPKGIYDIQVKRGYAYDANLFSFADYEYNSVVPYFFSHVPASSPPAIREEQSKIPAGMTWSAVSSVWDEYPLGEKGISLIAIKAKNVSINQLSVLATGYANTWNGSDWNTFEPTQNPASWYRHLALGGQSVDTRIVEGQLDDDSLEEWFEYCESDGKYTESLLHFDGADASTTFTDETGKVWTASGDAQIDTAQSKFGGASGLFDGTGDYISTPDHADFTLGPQDFTIEAQVRLNSLAATTGIAGHRGGAGNVDSSFSLVVLTNGTLEFRVYQGSGFVNANSSAGALAADGDFHHVALVRSGNTLISFVDGQVQASPAITGSVNPCAEILVVGAHSSNGSGSLNGWIDEFRLSVGIARWTENFTPPTAPYPFAPTRECNAFFSSERSLTDVLRVIAATGNASNRISDKVGVVIDNDRSDESPIEAFTQRNSSGLAIRRAFPRLPDGLRIAFNDEDNDYLPREIFAYRKFPANIIEAIDYTGITNEASARDRATRDLRQLILRSALYQVGTDIQHLYCTKGSLVALAHDTLRRHTDSARILKADTSGGDITDIHVDTALRLDLVGDAIGAKFLQDLNTKLLLHFDGSDGSTTFTDSSLGAHTFTAEGDADLDTGEFRFGTASGQFDGTGDYIDTPDSSGFTLGDQDFTIECWFFVDAAVGSSRHMAGQGDAAGDSNGRAWLLQRNADGRIYANVWQGTTDFTITSQDTYDNDENNPGWHHLAFTRERDILRMFIDGVQQGSLAFTGSVNDSEDELAIGRLGGDTANSPWLGWVDEFRLTVGEARYVRNFDVQGDAFPDPEAAYLIRGAGLSGAADSGSVAFSFWINPEELPTADQHLISIETSGDQVRFAIVLRTTGAIRLFGRNAAGTVILDIEADTTLLPGEWSHVCGSVDLSDTDDRHIVINDIESDLTVSTYTDDDIDFTTDDASVGGRPNGSQLFEGSLAEVWLEDGLFIDFSVEANRRDFISTNGRPTNLGSDGSAPGTSPLVYLSGQDGDFPTNKGTGGGFTENGSLGSESVFYSDAGFPAGVVIQLQDGTTLTAQVDEEDETSVLTFSTPQPLPSYLTDEGSWAGSTSYAQEDVVVNGGESYTCIADHTSGSLSEPGVGADWIDFWEPLLRDCLVASGPFTSVNKRMLVLGVKINPDLSASLTLVDEAPQPFVTGQLGTDDIYAPDGSRIRAPY